MYPGEIQSSHGILFGASLMSLFSCSGLKTVYRAMFGQVIHPF
jgi:hypothetical protein